MSDPTPLSSDQKLQFHNGYAEQRGFDLFIAVDGQCKAMTLQSWMEAGWEYPRFPDNRLRRSFVMHTNGEHPPIDRLAVMMQTLGEMTEDNERRAALAYAADFYGFKVYSK